MRFDKRHKWLKHLDFLFIDIISLAISYLFSYYIKFNDFNIFNVDIYGFVLFLELFALFGFSVSYNAYSGVLRRDIFDEIRCSILLGIGSSLVSIIVFFLRKVSASYSRQVFLVALAIYIVLSVLIKQVYKVLLKKGIIKNIISKPVNIVAVSSDGKLLNVLDNIKYGDRLNSFNIVGSFDLDKCAIDDVYDFTCSNNVDEVFFACSPSLIRNDVVSKLVNNNIGVHLSINDIFGFYPENTFTSKVSNYHTLGFGLYTFSARQSLYLLFKRVMDIFFSIIGMVLLLIAMIGIKIANVCNGDHGKLFYKHTRIGKDGKEFGLIKFRSMYEDADVRLKELLKDKKYRKEWEEYQKFNDDPRITKVGKFIRKTSIDELPQFINVFKGDMSLVGPRPLVKGELESHGGIKLYEQVKPGLTGWWAANGRSSINYEDRLELEYYYVKNASLTLDLRCIFMTIATIKRGAK